MSPHLLPICPCPSYPIPHQLIPRDQPSPYHKAHRWGRPITSPLIVSLTHPLKVLAASGLVKRDLFSLPNPFAVITTDGTDLRQTTVFKRTLTPYWNETFELFECLISSSPLPSTHPSLAPSAILPNSKFKSSINANSSETTRAALELSQSKSEK